MQPQKFLSIAHKKPGFTWRGMATLVAAHPFFLICVCVHAYTIVYTIFIYTRSTACYARNTYSPYVFEVHICPMHYYITCLLKSAQLELSHYLTLSHCLTLSHYVTLSHYLTLSHYPGLSQPRPLTLSLPKCLRMCTSNFLPQTRGRLISQWQKLVSLLAASLPRLPRGRS